MKASQSHWLSIRGLRYHVRTWGDPTQPRMFLLHGWMDVSASFQFLVDAFEGGWYAIAPDWRGFGLSEWASGGYWFPDYMADLDALLRHFSPDAPARVVGHSMGANVAGLYAGVRPQRIAKLALLEGFGLPRTVPAAAPNRYAKWLDEIASPPGFKPYATSRDVEDRLMHNNPRLTREKAHFLASHWAKRLDTGEFVLNSDPAHKMANPVLYRLDEAIACWQRISAATLWVWGDGEWLQKWLKGGQDDLAERRNAFARRAEVTIPDAGHMLHHDQPERLARVLETFMAAKD